MALDATQKSIETSGWLSILHYYPCYFNLEKFHSIVGEWEERIETILDNFLKRMGVGGMEEHNDSTL